MVQRGSEYFRIDATNLGGLGLADPNPPTDIVWSPQPPGSGTQADPYVLTPATVITPGGTATSVESCYIKNQKPDSLLLITEDRRSGWFPDGPTRTRFVTTLVQLLSSTSNTLTPLTPLQVRTTTV